jgi:PBP1b-binding outer membrane lipoprotein LpoB
MKKLSFASIIFATVLLFTSCGNEAPKTDLNQQEQASVDSTINSDQAALDSMQKVIEAQIGADMDSGEEENHEGKVQ